MAHSGSKQYNLVSVRPRIALITRMDTKKTEILYRDLSYKVVGLAMEPHGKLGYGFLENVYENSLMVLFEREGIQATQQVPTNVSFKGRQVGYYLADMIVAGQIILVLFVLIGVIRGQSFRCTRSGTNRSHDNSRIHARESSGRNQKTIRCPFRGDKRRSPASNGIGRPRFPCRV